MAKKKVLKQKQKTIPLGKKPPSQKTIPLGKKPPSQKQTQTQSVVIHLGKQTQRKATAKPSTQPLKSMQPIIVQSTQPVFPTPTYDFSRLENKIADLAKLTISKPVDPVITETIPLSNLEQKPIAEPSAELIREKRIQYLQTPSLEQSTALNEYSSIPQVSQEMPTQAQETIRPTLYQQVTGLSRPIIEEVRAEQPINRPIRQSRIPVAKTPEEEEARKEARRVQQREANLRYREKKRKEKEEQKQKK